MADPQLIETLEQLQHMPQSAIIIHLRRLFDK